MRGHVCPIIGPPRECIIPREEAMSPATVLFNALQGVHKPKPRAYHSATHLLPIFNHLATNSLNHSSEAPHHGLSTTEPGVPFSHVSCHVDCCSHHLRHYVLAIYEVNYFIYRQMSPTALVVVSPSRQKRKYSKANINDDINDEDDQVLDDAVIHHHKMHISRSTDRSCDKLSYCTSEVDDNDDDDLLDTTASMKKQSSPSDNSQSGHCDYGAIAEPTTMFNDGPVDWDDDDLGYLFMFKEGDDAIC